MFAGDNPKLKTLEWKTVKLRERSYVDHVDPFKSIRIFLIIFHSYTK